MSEGRLFLSYRREDASGHAGRLADHLLDRFGSGSVFMDVDSIQAGADFTAEIASAISSSEAVLVVIGPGWLDVRTPSGTRRLEEPDDFVRREVEAALSSEVRVIPVLVGGARMPAGAELPPSISALSLRNAIELQDRRWREDVDALVDVLEGHGRGATGNLPPQPTPFLGRERELAELAELLRRSDVRLVTLTGPGGIGKTRLAVQVASQLRSSYPGGAWFVGLAAVTDPGLLLVELSRMFRLSEAGVDDALMRALVDRLASVRTLVVLDNVEHLLPDVAAPIAELSAAAPALDLVVTSRQRLHVTAERESVIGALAPDAAIDLFRERASSVVGEDEQGDGPDDVIAAVCARLDGLPLAIELAAARTRLLDPATMLERLDHRLAILTGGARDLPERQQTLRASIDWSYELLSPEDRGLLARLSVFSGGWTLEAAESVCQDLEGVPDVLGGLESLERNSLIQRTPGAPAPRSDMLETVREYAAEILRRGAEADELARRHEQHYVSEAERTYERFAGPEPDGWFDRLEPELANVRAAIRSALDGDRAPTALRLMAIVSASLLPCGYWPELRAVGLDDVVARTRDVQSPERAEVLIAAGSMALWQGDVAIARPLIQEGMDLARDLDDRRSLVRALGRMTWARSAQGDQDDRTVALGEEAVDIARQLDDPLIIAEALTDLSSAFGEHAYSPRAVELDGESLRLRRSVGYLAGVAEALNNLGWQSLLIEEYPAAIAQLEESVEISRRLSLRAALTMAQDNLGLAYLLGGDPERAEHMVRDNVRILRDNGDRRVAAEAFIALAGSAASLGRWERAAWLDGASTALLTQLGLVPTEVMTRIRDRHLSSARQALGAGRYEEALTRGRSSSFEDAIAYALDEEPDS